MKRVNALPTLLTIGNFSCGFVSILFALHSVRFASVAKCLGDAAGEAALHRANETLGYACAAIFLAMIFDMLDGRVARMTGTESRFGAELDSLADDCSFGVAPAMAVLALWVRAQPETADWYGQVMVCGVVYAACAVIRLARYNVEIGVADKNWFTGLPSPAAAGAVASAVLFCRAGYLDSLWHWQWLVDRVPLTNEASELQARALGIYMLVIGLLMVTRLRFAHFTNKYFGGRQRLSLVVAMLFAFALLVVRPVEVLFLAFNGYVLVSLLANLRKRRAPPGPGVPPPPAVAPVAKDAP